MTALSWPTYERGNVKLICGNCLEVMPTLGKVDAVVTDPPYGIKMKCGTRSRENLASVRPFDNIIGDDNKFDPQPILGLGLPMILWGANHYASQLPDSSGWLVWDKERPDDLDQATCELAWTDCVKGVRRFRHLWNGCMKASEHGTGWHPAGKPVALMVWCLGLRWTYGFKSIVDPYMGSGTTGVACVKLGRAFIGIELDRKYFDIACKRIDQAFDDFGLIDPTPAGVLTEATP